MVVVGIVGEGNGSVSSGISGIGGSVVAAVGGGHEEGLLVRRHDRVEVMLEELPRACSHGCF